MELHGRSTRFTFALVALGLAGASTAEAQSVDRNRMFDLTIEAAGEIFGATVREGEPLRLTLNGTEQYEVSPVLPGGTGEEVLVAISRGTSVDGGATQILERLRIRPGAPATMRGHPRISVALDRIRYGTQGAVRAQPRPISFTLSRAYNPEICCVCCGGALHAPAVS